MPVRDYIHYWQQNIAHTGQIERRDWDDYWNNLVKQKIADQADREAFDDDFTIPAVRLLARDPESYVSSFGILMKPSV